MENETKILFSPVFHSRKETEKVEEPFLLKRTSVVHPGRPFVTESAVPALVSMCFTNLSVICAAGEQDTKQTRSVK